MGKLLDVTSSQPGLKMGELGTPPRIGGNQMLGISTLGDVKSYHKSATGRNGEGKEGQ